MEKFKPGDIYEDCAFHPCLCLEVKEWGEISGVSLIDGSFPRTCDIESCGVRKLTPEQALIWKNKGPQDVGEPWIPLPDKQWWWPRPVEGLNPGGILDHMFESSLNFLRNTMRETLGEDVVGWYSPSGNFSDTGPGSAALATYVIHCSSARGVVRVEAAKEGRLWPIQRITVKLEGNDSEFAFEGEEVRGCGRAG